VQRHRALRADDDDLKFSGCEVGLVINCNVTRLIDGSRGVIGADPLPKFPFE